MPKECLVCKRIEQIKNGQNKYFVRELETGYVVLGDYQFFKGYSLLLCKEHVHELHELEPDFREKFLAEMAKVAKAVHLAFKPKKINYELLGNDIPHLHWHIFPRYGTDPNPRGTTWCIDESIRYAKKPTIEEIESMKEQLLKHL